MGDEQRQLNILLAAEEAAGVQVLRMLLGTSHRIVAVLTSEPSGPARGATVWHLAEKQGIDIHPADRVRDRSFAADVRDGETDLLLNIHSLHVIRPEILEAPRIGGFNLHPGPLPQYSGLNAPSWAIYHGETRHAVTVHWMQARVDAGPIAYTTAFPIGEADTGLTVSMRCVREGVPLVRRLLETAAQNPAAIPRTPQEGKGRYYGRETPNDGKIDWSWPAARVAAFIRAASYHPMPSPWGDPIAHHGEQEIGFVRAATTGLACDRPPGTIAAAPDRGVHIACADEWLHADLIRVESRLQDPAPLLPPNTLLTTP